MTFIEKQIRAQKPVVVAGRHIKAYHVTRDGSEIDPAVRAAAYEFLPGLLPEPDGTPPATVAVLHLGGSGVYLNAYSWYWDNAVAFRGGVAGDPYFGCVAGALTDFRELGGPLIGCVWELPALEYERRAWVRHMLRPERTDLGAYLADTAPDGPVGQ
jgi:hypothetical protein